MNTKESARLRGRIYKEGRESYRTSLRTDSKGNWIAVLSVNAEEMQIELPLDLLDLEELILELNKTHTKLTTDIFFRTKFKENK